jgi:indolepyruvate decarboxylase
LALSRARVQSGKKWVSIFANFARPHFHWERNDLARWDYQTLPAALGCKDWFTTKVATLGELDVALARAGTADTACYVEVVGGRMDMPAGLAGAHEHLDAMYGNS